MPIYNDVLPCLVYVGFEREVRESQSYLLRHYNTITRTQVPLSKSALPTTPTNVRLTDFVIEFTSGDGEHTGVEEIGVEEKEHKKDRDFMIHCKDAAVRSARARSARISIQSLSHVDTRILLKTL